MIEEENTQPEEIVEEQDQQVAQAQPAVVAEDPYASQAHLPDENRIWPPPFVKKHG